MPTAILGRHHTIETMKGETVQLPSPWGKIKEHTLPGTETELNTCHLGEPAFSSFFFLLKKANSHSLVQNLGQSLLGILPFLPYLTDMISVPVVNCMR